VASKASSSKKKSSSSKSSAKGKSTAQKKKSAASARKSAASAKKFLEAVAAGDAAKVKKLLEKDPELASSRDPAGVSATLHAAYNGHHEVLEALFGTGIEPDLFEAAAVGRQGRVEEILEADPGAVESTSPDGFSPLGLAAFFGHSRLVELLLAHGADPNRPSENAMKVAPLHSAVAHRGPAAALEMARLLLANGARVDVVQAGGWTPLHQAAASGHEELVRLLRAHGADLTAQSDDGRTSQQIAEERGHRALAVTLAPPTAALQA